MTPKGELMDPVDGTPRLKGVGLGAGYFAPFQYEAWTRIPEAEIAAIYNRTEDRAASDPCATMECLATTAIGGR